MVITIEDPFFDNIINNWSIGKIKNLWIVPEMTTFSSIVQNMATGSDWCACLWSAKTLESLAETAFGHAEYPSRHHRMLRPIDCIHSTSSGRRMSVARAKRWGEVHRRSDYCWSGLAPGYGSYAGEWSLSAAIRSGIGSGDRQLIVLIDALNETFDTGRAVSQVVSLMLEIDKIFEAGKQQRMIFIVRTSPTRWDISQLTERTTIIICSGPAAG